MQRARRSTEKKESEQKCKNSEGGRKGLKREFFEMLERTGRTVSRTEVSKKPEKIYRKGGTPLKEQRRGGGYDRRK